MEIPEHLTCLLKNLYAGQEATVRTGYGKTGSKLGKEYGKDVYCHPAYLTYIQSTACKTPDWMKHRLKTRLLGEISQPQICRRSPYSRKWRRAKEPLDKGEKESEKACLKLNIQKNIKASSPITSKQIEGEKVETVKDFIFLGSKITVDCDCSLEIERCLLLGKKAKTIISY